MWLVSDNREHAAQLLCSQRADVNIQDDNGTTALMIASQRNHINIITLLCCGSMAKFYQTYKA